MNIGYEARVWIAELNGCILYALYEANHYFHRCGDGRIWNEKEGYWIKEYVMDGPSGKHTLAGAGEDARGNFYKGPTDKKRLLAHWRGFCEDAEAKFRLPNKTFKSAYYTN